MICHDNYNSDENSSLSLLYTGKLDVSHVKLPNLYGCAILSYMQIGVSVLVEGRIPENGVPKAAFHALLTEHFEIPKFLFFRVTPKLHRHLSAQSNRSQIPNFPSQAFHPPSIHPSLHPSVQVVWSLRRIFSSAAGGPRPGLLRAPRRGTLPAAAGVLCGQAPDAFRGRGGAVAGETWEGGHCRVGILADFDFNMDPLPSGTLKCHIPQIPQIPQIPNGIRLVRLVRFDSTLSQGVSGCPFVSKQPRCGTCTSSGPLSGPLRPLRPGMPGIRTCTSCCTTSSHGDAWAVPPSFWPTMRMCWMSSTKILPRCMRKSGPLNKTPGCSRRYFWLFNFSDFSLIFVGSKMVKRLCFLFLNWAAKMIPDGWKWDQTDPSFFGQTAKQSFFCSAIPEPGIGQRKRRHGNLPGCRYDPAARCTGVGLGAISHQRRSRYIDK